MIYKDTGDNSEGFSMRLHPEAKAGPILNPALSKESSKLNKPQLLQLV